MFIRIRIVSLTGLIAFLAAALYAATASVTVTSARIDYSTSTLTVYGSGFSPAGTAPTVIFNGHPLALRSFTRFVIAASLPSALKQGSYEGIVRNSEGQSAAFFTDFDYDPTLATDSTLKGNGTSGAPLGVNVPLTLSSSSETTPTLILSNNSVDYTPALYIPIGFVQLDTGGLRVYAPGVDAIDALAYYGASGVSGSGAIGVYGSVCCAGFPSYGVAGDSVSQPGVVGIYGIGGTAQDEYAGQFEGDVDITGKLTKAGGSFKIDHPLDPANKYLSHSFVESPDMKNIYDGTVITDRTGIAVVTLPDWFEALNRDFRYQLTVIGQFAQASIAQEVTNNQFMIRTDKPSVKVSWQITGIRQDAWANAHRIPVEEDKPEKERDHYLHPELFNQPPEKSIEWARHPEAQKKLAEHRAQVMSKAAQHN